MPTHQTKKKGRRLSAGLEIPSIRASHAGNQFHYLWAARQCLRLLLPKDDLIEISIEGASPREHNDGRPVRAGEEVIDVAEYFGKEENPRPKRVRYVQLKHSTRQGNGTWTASGLEKTIKGFAGLYKKFMFKFLKPATRNYWI